MVFGFLRRRRRERIRATPFPAERLRIVQRGFPQFSHLSAASQQELLGHVQVLLAEKRFEGCGGLVLTDEIRVTIATQAARLLLNRGADYFPGIVSILVYPSALSYSRSETLEGGIVRETQMSIAGLATGRRNVIILTWDQTTRGVSDPGDAYNVVLHEFAHALDYQDQSFDGTPLLDSRASYSAWGRTMQAAFDAHRAAIEEDRETVLDEYAATDPAEFFAVTTEHFFERPVELRDHHPDVYAALQNFYQQDPAGLVRAATTSTVTPTTLPS
jgi:Mlc titration factor MtfA (ptsG expression regulator)